MVCLFTASQLNCRFIPSPSQPQTRARVLVAARVGHGVLMVGAFDGDRRQPRHPMFIAGIRLRVDLLSEA